MVGKSKINKRATTDKSSSPRISTRSTRRRKESTSEPEPDIPVKVKIKHDNQKPETSYTRHTRLIRLRRSTQFRNSPDTEDEIETPPEVSNEDQTFWESETAKVRSFFSQLSSYTNAATMAMKEISQTQNRVDELKKKVNELKTQSMLYNQCVLDLDKKYKCAKAEITMLREREQPLDSEIATYRKLLEDEERRLNITPVVSPSARHTPNRSDQASKRRCEESEKTFSTYYYEVNKAENEVFPEGGYVKITNKSDESMSLSRISSDTKKIHDPQTHAHGHENTMVTHNVNYDGEAEHEKQLRSSTLSHAGGGFCSIM